MILNSALSDAFIRNEQAPALVRCQDVAQEWTQNIVSDQIAGKILDTFKKYDA